MMPSYVEAHTGDHRGARQSGQLPNKASIHCLYLLLDDVFAGLHSAMGLIAIAAKSLETGGADAIDMLFYGNGLADLNAFTTLDSCWGVPAHRHAICQI
jgi:hypothetical protein